MRLVAAVALALVLAPAAAAKPHVLLFTKTAAFRHDSIPAAVQALSAQPAIAADHTEDAGAFTDANLARCDVVVFLLTTGDVLDDAQQAALERFVRSGGGFVGVHSATDTEYDWPWYGQLVGAYFKTHAEVQQATLDVVDPSSLATASLPRQWTRTDEWYSFRAPPQGVHVLLTLDGNPLAWQHDFDGGRAFYTALGHTPDAWSEPLLVGHVVGGIRWAAGLAAPRVVGVVRKGRVVTARVPGCHRCVASVGGRRVAVVAGRLRLTLPVAAAHFTLRVENRADGRATTVRR